MIAIITAMTKDGVIGRGNALPWHIPDELKYFKKITQGQTVIMGKRTFESIGRPLPNRHNIVLAPEDTSLEGVCVCSSVQQALSVAQTYGKDIFIIGGAYTYAQFLERVDRLYISYIKHAYEGDVFFPAVEWNSWKEVERCDYPEFVSVMYQR
ncbi:MAG: dihydrofolate reductase [Epsilonproteobacteria bacterium]|nr:dihydrofolate reductase [Campylobacterota bacterium]